MSGSRRRGDAAAVGIFPPDLTRGKSGRGRPCGGRTRFPRPPARPRPDGAVRRHLRPLRPALAPRATARVDRPLDDRLVRSGRAARFAARRSRHACRRSPHDRQAHPAGRSPACERALRRARDAGAGARARPSSPGWGRTRACSGRRRRRWRRWRRRRPGSGATATRRRSTCARRSRRITGCAPANVMVGEGIDALLGNLVRLLVAEGAPVVTSAGAYPTFNYHVTGFGGVIHAAPYRDDAEDPEALLALARTTGARLVYLANPDNPMGSLADRGGGRGAGRRPAGGRAAVPRRGLCGFRAGRRGSAARHGRAPGDPDADLLQGLRHGRGAGGLCAGRGRADRGLRPGSQPLRGEPDRAGRRAGGAGGPGVARVGAGRGRGGEGADRRDRGGAGAARRCPRRRISSPSTAVGTATSPGPWCAG